MVISLQIVVFMILPQEVKHSANYNAVEGGKNRIKVRIYKKKIKGSIILILLKPLNDGCIMSC